MLWGGTDRLVTDAVFSAAQNSSYGGDGRFSTLSSAARDETLVGFHLNLSHPPFRNDRFRSMPSCVCTRSLLFYCLFTHVHLDTC